MILRFFSKDELLIGGVALLLSGGLFLFVHFSVGPEGFGWGGNDFTEYRTLAENVLAGRGFSLRNAAPYEPSASRTPGYPLFLAFSLLTTGGTLGASIIQMFLLAGIGIAAYRILLLLGFGRVIACAASLLTIAEPDVLSMSAYLISDALFTFLLLLSFYFFLRFLAEREQNFFWLASGVLGISAAVRPVALAAWALYLFGFWMIRGAGGMKWRALALGFLLAGAFTAPWVMRNAYQFGAWKVSSADTYNLYTIIGSQIVSYRDGIPYADAREALLNQFLADENLKPFPPADNVGYPAQRSEFLLADSFRYDQWMRDRFWEIFWSSPGSWAKAIVLGAFEYATQVNWLTPLEHWGIMRPSYQPLVSIKDVFLNEGIGSLAREIGRRFSCGSSCVLSFGLAGAGRIYWSLLFILSCIGFRQALGRWPEKKILLWCAAIFVMLLAALHIFFVGILVQPRYRMPSVPFFTAFGLLGISVLFRKTRSILRLA
ncbi:MAG: phospholipid carrier-dependent glycosyltransferase [Patescibacteria group bacterium]